MSDFFRPEVRQWAWRYRDALAGVATALLGGFWVWRSFGILFWIGLGFILLGVIWTVAGTQRARFRQGSEGPGVVEIREGALAYFGPLDGGVMHTADLQCLEFDPTSYPAPSWILTGDPPTKLAIPVNASGAEALFDVFNGLPGIRTDAVLRVLSQTPEARHIVWQRQKPLLQ